MRIIAIIPARSGSKGLKDKNIKPLRGKPLMAYTIEAALHSGCFDEVCVSTDSEKYAEIARQYGASVPFLRSEKNSSDKASSWDAVREVLENYKAIGKQFGLCMLLQPTSPLRGSGDIKKALDIFLQHNADSVVSVCEADYPPQCCFRLDGTLSMEEFDKNPYKNARRQELERYYRVNGAIYIFEIKKLESEKFDFYGPNCFAYIMDRKSSVDIDDKTDFEIAEALMKG